MLPCYQNQNPKNNYCIHFCKCWQLCPMKSWASKALCVGISLKIKMWTWICDARCFAPWSVLVIILTKLRRNMSSFYIPIGSISMVYLHIFLYFTYICHTKTTINQWFPLIRPYGRALLGWKGWPWVRGTGHLRFPWHFPYQSSWIPRGLRWLGMHFIVVK